MAQRSLLLIADIGGYTRFMSIHRVNLAHAQDVVARLLEAIIDASKKRLKLSKLEGDAALFYAPLPEKAGELEVRQLVSDMRDAFVARQRRMEVDRICTCEGCTQAGQLKLKFVAHVGEVAIQKVKRFRELAGVDVILVHRMLKNSVPVNEYVLVTEDVLQATGDLLRPDAEPLDEDFEGLGTHKVFYVDLAKWGAPQPKDPPKSGPRALWAHLGRNFRSIPSILGIRKPCVSFDAPARAAEPAKAV